MPHRPGGPFDEFGFTTRQFTGEEVLPQFTGQEFCFECGRVPDECFCDDFWLTEEDRYFE